MNPEMEIKMPEPAYSRKVILKNDYHWQDCFIPANTVIFIEAYGSFAYRIVSHFPEKELIVFVTEFK